MQIACTARCRARHSIDPKLIGVYDIVIDAMEVHPYGLVFLFLSFVSEFPSYILGRAPSAE